MKTDSEKRRHWRGWAALLLSAAGAWAASATLHPAQARATTFQSPTPAPVSTVINQPYVTFQTARVSHKLFTVGNNVPIYWVLLVLVLLLGAVTFYRSSGRPRH